ncbi:hypothetical protein D3C81_1480240 [compost metagenome]
MKKVPTLNMPKLTKGLLNNRKTLPAPALRGAAVMAGRLIHCQINAMIATGIRQKKAPRQPMTLPR